MLFFIVTFLPSRQHRHIRPTPAQTTPAQRATTSDPHDRQDLAASTDCNFRTAPLHFSTPKPMTIGAVRLRAPYIVLSQGVAVV